MKRARIPVLTIALLALMFVVSSDIKIGRGVDPEKTLQAAFDASANSKFTARQMWTWVINGKHFRRKIEVRSPTWQGVDYQAADLVRKNYTPLIEGEDTIAGRKTWVLRLKPHIKHRPWKQLWIDCKTGVVLAMRDWDSRNRIKSTMRTLSISYSDTSNNKYSQNKVDHVSNTKPIYGYDEHCLQNIPHPRYTPRGYKLVRIIGPDDFRPSQLVYSDGLYSLSVFLRFPNSQGGEQNKIKHAYDWGQGLALAMHDARKKIVVVGDLPLTEIERVARSVR